MQDYVFSGVPWVCVGAVQIPAVRVGVGGRVRVVWLCVGLSPVDVGRSPSWRATSASWGPGGVEAGREASRLAEASAQLAAGLLPEGASVGGEGGG
jgi:hypothetical protein